MVKNPGSKYSTRGLSWVMRETLKKTSIVKKVNLHSLRHAYSTHLMEEGVNIVTLKELLGHSQITTTMIYLHVAQCKLILCSKVSKNKNTHKCENPNP